MRYLAILLFVLAIVAGAYGSKLFPQVAGIPPVAGLAVALVCFAAFFYLLIYGKKSDGNQGSIHNHDDAFGGHK